MVALRSGRKVASYTGEPKKPAKPKTAKKTKADKPLNNTKGKAKVKKPVGVTKAGPSKTGGKKDGGKKVPSARERAQAVRKAKAEAKNQQQEQQRKENIAKKKEDRNPATTQKPIRSRKNNQRRKAPSTSTRRTNSTSSSTLSSISDSSLALLEASINNNHANDKHILNFWLKPHLQTYNPTIPKSRDALSPRSAGVQKPVMRKWGRYALPPFGKPFWQKSRKAGRLELLLPMLVSQEEKKAVEEEGWFEGMKGRIERHWDEDDDRRGDDGRDDGDESEDGGANDDEESGDKARDDQHEYGSESGDDGHEKGGEGGNQHYNGNNTGETLETGDTTKGHGTGSDRPLTVSSDEEDEDEEDSLNPNGERLELGIHGPEGSVTGQEDRPLSPSPESEDGFDNDGDEEEGEGPITQLHTGNPQVDHSRKDVTSPDSSDSEQPPYSVDYPDPRRPAMPPQIQRKGYDVVEVNPDGDGLGDDSKRGDELFLTSYHGYEDGWVGKTVLGIGSEGRVGLWEKYDSDGKVTDEVCIKQKKDLNHDPKLRKPMDVKILEDLRDRADNGSTRLRAYRRYPKIMAHRLYVDFCRHGDLSWLIKRYRYKKQYLPEEFIWDVFHHLVNAVKAMDAGPSNPKYPELTTFVHRDIKPDNIFLADSRGYDDGGIPIYPTTILGDFGLATITGVDDDRHNPSMLKWKGTPGYKAPEQQVTFDLRQLYSLDETNWKNKNDYRPKGVTSEWPLLGTHTNIWGVGACMYELIILTPVALDLNKAATEGKVLGKVETHRIPEYSKALTDLVHQCLKIDPERRPTLQELETKIESRRSSFRNRWARGKNVPQEAALHLHDDEFARMESGPFIMGEHVPFDWENHTVMWKSNQ